MIFPHSSPKSNRGNVYDGANLHHAPLRTPCGSPITSDNTHPHLPPNPTAVRSVALTLTRLATAVDVLNRSAGWRPLVENAAGRGGEPSIPGIMDPTASMTASEVRSPTEDTPLGTELLPKQRKRVGSGQTDRRSVGRSMGRSFHSIHSINAINAISKH